MTLTIHPDGILIKTARVHMWCVRIKEELYAASRVEKLHKWFSYPDAKFGVWIKVAWTESEAINKSKDRTAMGFMDLLTGEFYKQDKKKFGQEINAWTGRRDDQHAEIFQKVAEAMLEKWRKRFEIDQRNR